MSDLIPFVPGQLPASIKEELDDVTKALAGKRGGSRISIKGGVFRMIEGGKEVAKNDDRAMDVVIVNCSPHTGRAFYAGGYVEGGDNKPPTCWSDDGQRPNKECKTPVAPTCATCPKNVKGSGQGESKACRYNRHLAVMLPNDLSEGRVYKLTLAATSIFGEGKQGALPLEAYAKMVANYGVNVSRMVTEMRFDTSVSTPKLTFWPAGYLSDSDYEKAKAAGQTPEALEAIRTTVFAQDTGSNEPADSAPAQVREKAQVKDDDEPVVVQKTKSASEAPSSTKEMLAKWDE